MAVERETVALMFSGGRDSSLAACLYALTGVEPRLLSFQTGLGINGELRAPRVEELRRRFPDVIGENVILPAFGLVRKIATAQLEEDFRRFDGKNLILLGEKLALHACTIAYALQNGISRMADGSSGYQRHLPEQRDVAVDLFHSVASRYGITYETPILDITSEDEVKYALLELGLSTKSLEGTSMFADAFSVADSSTIASYLRAKEHMLHEHIELVVNGRLPSATGDEANVVSFRG